MDKAIKAIEKPKEIERLKQDVRKKLKDVKLSASREIDYSCPNQSDKSN
ncbi:MAG: hypothetical protein QNJ37_06730 [Crocosphaera sp.]|nr:hypothetical protein [Crocosphaera sp.]